MPRNDKNPESTYKQFQKMVDWVTNDMDREPKTTGGMMAQSFGAVGKTVVLIGWLYAKTLGFMLRKIIGGIKMVLGRKKKERIADNPAFIPQQTAQQLIQQGAVAIPTEFPTQQSVQQPAYPPVQQPAQQPVQLPAMPPTPPMPPTSMPAQPAQEEITHLPPEVIQRKASAHTGAVLEQLMQTFISLGEKIKEQDERLAVVENQLDELYRRVNRLSGIHTSGAPIRFER